MTVAPTQTGEEVLEVMLVVVVGRGFMWGKGSLQETLGVSQLP